MELDPHIAGMLAHLRGLGVPDLAELPVPALREVFSQNCRQMEGPPPDAPLSVRDVTLTGAAGSLAGRLYQPVETVGTAGPAILYFHGGGFVAGGLESHEMACRRLAALSGLTVLAATYRLAPEHPFPAAHDDALAILAQVARDGAMWDIDPAHLIIAGDSAGANLALATALDVDLDHPPLRGVLLFYPAASFTADFPSRSRLGQDYLLTERSMRLFTDLALPDPARRNDTRINLLHRDQVSPCPPVLLYTAGFDPLCDEGGALAARLQAAGVAVSHREAPGLIHAFIHMTGVSPAVLPILADAAGWCRHMAQRP